MIEEKKRKKQYRNEIKMERRKQNGMKWTGNNIGASGAMKIGEALMTNNTLTKLYLRGDNKDIKWKKKRKEAR